MASETYPLAVPEDLMVEVRKVAKSTHLSLADAMRQSMRLGLPKLVEQLSADPLAGLKPFTKAEREQCWGKGSRHELDELEHYCASLPAPVPDAE